jgi:L-ascorbate metabolism protein UlaG (beta-lactamase superfamily)
MTITKLGHCCLVVEVDGIRILTDPGAWTTAQATVRDIDVILITHEHADHLHIDSLRTVLTNNPRATVFTNRGVGAILEREHLSYQLLEDTQSVLVKGTAIQGHGEKHAPIYPSVPDVQNTGYMIADSFFYPGDALSVVPPQAVELLALPVVGPWLRLAEALDYAQKLKPKRAFPVHDGMLKILGPFHQLPEKILGAAGIQFTSLKEGEILQST